MLLRPLLLLSLLVGLLASPAFALEVPKHSGPVVDLAGVLSRTEQNQIAASLVHFRRTYGPQLQVLVIPELQDETIETFSIKVVDKWQLGDKAKDDGVLLLVATADRKVRIEVGQGLEGDLPDALAGRIVQNGIIPFFKQGQVGAGILTGLSLIAESVGGKLENVPTPRLQRQQRGKPSSSGFVIFLLLFLIGPRLFGGRRRRGMGGALLGGMLLGSALGGRHGGGGFGGGGGGFSGGGASGSW